VTRQFPDGLPANCPTRGKGGLEIVSGSFESVAMMNAVIPAATLRGSRSSARIATGDKCGLSCRYVEQLPNALRLVDNLYATLAYL
jgi:hypothetical protein